MLIGISGKIGSGKDSLCRAFQYIWLKENLIGYNYHFDNVLKFYQFNPISLNPWKNKKFAEKLKQMTALALNKPYSEIESREFKDNIIKNFDITGRSFLEQLGSKMREIDEDFWIKSLFSSYNDSENWIVTDMRYENEFEFLKSKGAIMIKVIRPDNNNKQSDHKSNEELDKIFDFVCINNKPEDLIKTANQVLCK